jgi:alkylation response protein AidB-like acyl-CoA dehydrogenase
MVLRSQERSTFGKRIDEYSSTQAAISLSRIELDQCRLIVQQAAHLLDTVGNKEGAQTNFYDQSRGGQ